MARISLWKPIKGNDYNFTDRVAKENLFVGGNGILVHKYAGTTNGDETEIQDKLFLENRDRNYDTDVIELRGHFRPTDTDYDLSQFGIFMSSDTVRFEFHFNDMVEKLGRKLMSGDVLEVPSEKDININGIPLNSYYVVQDALYSASGYGAGWYPHMWKLRAKKMDGAPEFADILESAASGYTAGNEGNGTGLMPAGWGDTLHDANPLLCAALSAYCTYLGISDAVIKEAASNVFYDPKFFETQHLYIELDDNGYPQVSKWASGDGVPPNGAALRGLGTSFPEDMIDGEYFLRIDYTPDRLFQKQGNCYARIEDDLRKIWTATNSRLDTYINNTNTTNFDNGAVTEKQGISNAGASDIDTNADHKEEITVAEESRKRKAKRLDGAD